MTNQYTEIVSCTIDDKIYPTALKNIRKAPKKLYYRGAFDILNRYKNVAIIGTRNASETGLRFSFESGKRAGEKGLTLVNGLALGCDTEAIRGALSVGGRCVAIMPCGLDEIYPKSNRELAEQILENGGCLVSEYPVRTAPERFRFVERDRLQSGVSQGILVIEADEKSGTMHTANYAMDQGRRLACYYHALMDLCSGNRYLGDSGKARVLKEKKDLDAFFDAILAEETYEQISFCFS